MKDISYLEGMALATEHMSHEGVFLNVPGDNSMTIGWGSIGYFWQRPVFAVVVRPSRYTYDLINKAGRFTVSVCLDGAMKRQLALAGTLSGRDGDKFERCGLEKQPARFIDCPVVGQCQLHFECVVRLQQDMTKDQMDENVIKSAYPDGDLHRVYFGEIVGCYRTDE